MQRSRMTCLVLLGLAGVVQPAWAQLPGPGSLPPADSLVQYSSPPSSTPPTGGVVRPTAPPLSGTLPPGSVIPPGDLRMVPPTGSIRRPTAPPTPPQPSAASLHDCPEKGCCSPKICVPDIQETTTTKICYGMKCKTICLPACRFCGKDCDCNQCGKPREIHILMKRFVPQTICKPVCVPVEAPCGTPCCSEGCPPCAGTAPPVPPPGK